MVASTVSFPVNSPLDPLHVAFLSILPKIERHGRVYFRHEKCRDRRADRIAEMVALAWKWFVQLAQRGKDACKFPTVLASFAARAVKSGRKIGGMNKASDVMNEITQQRRGFSVESLPSSPTTSRENLYGKVNGQRQQDEFEERLCDNTQTPVPDQVAFRLDFPEWLTTRTERDRRIITDMGRSERTQDLSRKFGISEARISQLRREYHDDWERFTA